MNYYVLDFETSTLNYGSAFHKGNIPVCVVLKYSIDGHSGLFLYHFFDRIYNNCTLADITDFIQRHKAVVVVGHNVKVESHWMRRLGWIASPLDHSWYDTMFLPYLMKYGLAKKGDLTLETLSKQADSYKDNLGNLLVHEHGLNPAELPTKWVLEYCLQDVIATEKLFLTQQQELAKIHTAIQAKYIPQNYIVSPHKLMLETLPVVMEMEWNGFKVDLDEVEWIRFEAQQTKEKIIKKIRQEVGVDGFNPNSTKQVSEYIYSLSLASEHKEQWQRWFRGYNFFKDSDGTIYKSYIKTCFNKLSTGLGLEPTQNSVNGASLSVDKDTIKELLDKNKDHPKVNILQMFYDVSRLDTLISTFCDAVIEHLYEESDGFYLHTNYNQCIAATGRFTSSNPNLQNWPRAATFPIRRSVVSRFKGGGICKSDASQLELRYGMYYFNDAQGRKDYEDGIDIHAAITEKVYNKGWTKEQRDGTKATVFRTWYRGSAASIVKDQKIPVWDLDVAKQIVRSIYDRYQGVENGQQADYDKVVASGGWMITPTGRVYKFDLTSYQLKFKIANYPIQGGATADLIPCAMIAKMHRMRSEGCKSLFFSQTHDDMSTDVYPGEEERIKAIDYWALTQGCREVWKRMFGFEFDFPLNCEPTIKRHW